MPINPAQQKQLDTWAEKRDALLRDIGVFTTERDERKKEADAEALRLSDLRLSIANAEGRLAALDRFEESKKNSVSNDLAELVARKSRLEGENAEQEAKLNGARREFTILITATDALADSHGMIKDHRDAITGILGNIKTTSTEHLSEAKEILATTKAIADTVMDRANENLSQTKIVIEKMPKMIFDMQRPIPVRRTYPAGHPHAHRGIVRDNEKSS